LGQTYHNFTATTRCVVIAAMVVDSSRASGKTEAGPSVFPWPSENLRTERHLVVDGVKGFLCQLLGRLDVTIPGAAAGVRLAGRVAEDARRLAQLVDVQARIATESAARVREGAAARRRAVRTDNHLVDLGQVNADPTDWRGRVDLFGVDAVDRGSTPCVIDITWLAGAPQLRDGRRATHVGPDHMCAPQTVNGEPVVVADEPRALLATGDVGSEPN
jgi:hypothetical protein